MTLARRLAVALVATLTVATFLVQAAVLRPHLYPAGAGLTLSGDAIMNELAEPPPVGFAHVPDVGAALGQSITITNVWPEGSAARAGLTVGMIVTGVEDASGRRVEWGGALPENADAVIRLWAQIYRLSPSGPVTLTVIERPGDAPHRVTLDRPPVWSLGWSTFSRWFWEFHGAVLDKHLVYTLAALLIVALGARGITATLMTLAFLLMGSTDDGPLMGAEWNVPVLGPALLAFTWMQMAVAIPIIGLAVLYFPSRSPLLDRHPWVTPALWLITVPLAIIGGLTTAHLLGADSVAPAVAWLALRPWLFNICWGIGLASNIALVFEAVLRYRRSSDKVARYHIQTVLATGVPGMFAYVLMTAVPLTAANLGVRFRWPWPIHVGLETIVLLSAFGLAYAVAVRRAMSPRTALRQGIQYTLARKTLGLLTVLPAALLIVELIRQSDQPLSQVILGQPLFYVGLLVLIVAGLRYRDAAQKWLDRRFFRSEYDAREILLSLASRVPKETDPRALLSLVLTDVEIALHPASIAVLAENGGAYEVVEARQRIPAPVPAASGMVQLLQWSDAPLEVFLNDPRSTVGRLPASDREWLRASDAALLVPVLAGTSVERPLVGFIVLGPKRSEESVHRRGSTAARRHRRADGAGAGSLATAASGGRHAARLRLADARAGHRHTGVGRRRRDHRREVPHRRAGGPGRHGGRVPRARHAAGSGRRGEGGARGPGVVGRGARALQARSANGRATAAPRHRDGLRLRHAARRLGISGDGICARRGPARPHDPRHARAGGRPPAALGHRRRC